MPIRELKDQIARLPEQPGVYLYFNAAGDTIYVGKARALRDRVRNYLGSYGASPRTDALLDEIARLETIVTDSVVEALALENNLIKERTPKYNIRLRDDKNYPYLQLTTNEAFPRVLVARRVERDGAYYAGPFMPARFARKTMSLTHRLFGIRSCNELITGQRGRPCLEYDIKRCIAPCVEAICSPEEYGRAVRLTQLFLENKNDELVDTLTTRMRDAAWEERFEEAAQLRDAVRTIQTLHDRQQKMATVALGNRDVFGAKIGPAGAVIQVFQVRHGRVVERLELGSEEAIAGTRDGEVLEAALQQFYELREAPAEIHVPSEPDNRETLETWLSGRAGRKVRILIPQRGEKRGLIDLARRNAALAYQNRFNQATAAQYEALETLQSLLALPALPRRIECFDISTLQGSETVASMVVCEDGRMRRSDYRKFRIRGSSRGQRGKGTTQNLFPSAKDSESVGSSGGETREAPEVESLRARPSEGEAAVNGEGGAAMTGEAESLCVRPSEGEAGVNGEGGAAMTREAESLCVRPSEGEAGVNGEGGAAMTREAESLRSRPSHSEAAAARGGGAPRELKNDDFASMHEVVTRRYRKLLEEGGPFPDLIVIDGGKGQLSAAYEALEQLGLSNLVAIGLAKKEELIFTRDHADPMALVPNDPALLLLQRIRDEAHRFAVTFHRSSRARRDLRSELDSVPGIGLRRRRTLLTRFGSLAGVRRASREELVAAVGPRVADAVLAFFQTRP